MASMVRTPRILQKFYVYDPNIADTFGGLTVMHDKDGSYVLAVLQQVQYWMDQGLIGEKPVSGISPAHRKLLAQLTRGRSEDNDAEPARIPRYDRRVQSGHPALAGQPGYVQRKNRRKARQQERKKDDKPPKKPEPKAAM